MNKDLRHIKGRNHLLLKSLTPIALSTVLLGCGDNYTPAEPYYAPPLEDAARDESGNAQVEYLDRGLIVVPALEGGNSLSWRMSGLDEQRIIFKVYKNDEFFLTVDTGEPTFLTDDSGVATDTYQIKAIVDDEEKDVSKVVSVTPAPYLSIPLNKPANSFAAGVEYSYSANDATAADLTGDGQYEIIVKWDPSNQKDNSQSGTTGNVLIDAYTLEGEMLWRIDLGQNIRAGAHYTQFIAYDFNQDGRAEIAMKTADGTFDGQGNPICNPSTGECSPDADYRNSNGYILTGPEYLTVFDGISGAEIDTIDYVPGRGDVSAWGDSYGNRVDRFLAGVAYLDGAKPSLIMSRGYYTRAVIASFNFDGQQLTTNWVYDSDEDDTENNIYGEGAHSLSIADVDNDGKDEIVFGAAVVDDNGTALYSTGLGHGDALHVADIIPDNPGLEIFMPHECPACYTVDGVDYGSEIHDAATGEVLLYQSGSNSDVGRGVAGDIDPNYPGMETWASRGGVMAADGTIISDSVPSMNFMVWWDGDLNREFLNDVVIKKWDPSSLVMEKTPLLDAGSFKNGLAVSNNSTKATPSLSADIIGDWREEVIFANEESTRLMVYSSNIPTDVRLPTLMHDRQYRTAIAWQNVGYNQPPHPGFYLGSDIKTYQHVLAELPPYKTTQVTVQKATTFTVQGNNSNVLVKVFPGDAALSSVEILRSETADKNTAVSVGMLTDGETTFTDTTAIPDTTYYYWVEGRDASGTIIAGLDGMSKAQMTSSLLPRFAVASQDKYTELAWITNLKLQSVRIYRAETTDESVVPDIADRVEVAQPDIRANTWRDTNTVEGGKYYYWLELLTDDGILVQPDPLFGENVVKPITNLSYSYLNDTMEVCWYLENFPPLLSTTLMRNTVNAATNRISIVDLYDDEMLNGCHVDTKDLLADTDYWYMFKYFPEAGGSPTSEIVGPFTTALNNVNITVSADADSRAIDVNWSLYNFEKPIVSVALYRDTVTSISGSSTLIAEDLDTVGTLRDTGMQEALESGTVYYYGLVVTFDDNSEMTTDAQGVIYELPTPETNLRTSLEDGGIRIDYNLTNFEQEIVLVELLRNTENAVEGAILVSSDLGLKGVYAEYEGLVELQTYWYIMRVTLADGTEFVSEPAGEIEFSANPNATALKIEENQVGFCSVDGWIENNNPGFTGDGFANTDNQEGKTIKYKAYIVEAGIYRFEVRYANGAGDNRWGRLDINDNIGVAVIDMESTGAWTEYQSNFVDVELEIGDIDITLYSGTASGLANVDNLTIEARTAETAPIAVACAGTQE